MIYKWIMTDQRWKALFNWWHSSHYTVSFYIKSWAFKKEIELCIRLVGWRWSRGLLEGWWWFAVRTSSLINWSYLPIVETQLDCLFPVTYQVIIGFSGKTRFKSSIGSIGSKFFLWSILYDPTFLRYIFHNQWMSN